MHNEFARRLSFWKLSGEIPAGGSILDIGCGPGNWLYPFRASHRVFGLDISGEAVRLAKASGIADAQVYDGKRIPFKGGAFDVVLCHHVLEHVADPKALLCEIRRVLSLAGKLILTVPHKRVHPQDASHINFWDEAGLSALVRSAGFSRVVVKRPYWRFFRGCGRIPFGLALRAGRAYAALSAPQEVEIEARR